MRKRTLIIVFLILSLACPVFAEEDGGMSIKVNRPGNEDELPQAERITETFCREHPGVMKVLLADRGYISGDLIGRLKTKQEVDVVIPLKKHMHI